MPYAGGPNLGAVLAPGSTLAGNLFLVGSIAHLIVAEQGARKGVRITRLDHARVGVPVTFIALALAAVARRLARG